MNLRNGNLYVMDDTAMGDLNRHGWTSFAATLEDVIVHAATLGWEAVPVRRGDPLISSLRPVSASRARPNSLSSRTGMGAQPLHTDGAHLLEPPDIVALASISPHPAATRLWAMQASDVPWEDLRHGLFRVCDGRMSFYSLAVQDDFIRFDPFCMTPCDGRARRVVEFFRSSFATSKRHEWSSDNPEVLMIDNRRTLHARDAVCPTDPPRLLRRIAFRQMVTV